MLGVQEDNKGNTNQMIVEDEKSKDPLEEEAKKYKSLKTKTYGYYSSSPEENQAPVFFRIKIRHLSFRRSG